ncbi:sporulation delaying protein family toxin [Bacillus sp. WL1]|uniref:sporulation delaying protein family toxin n=1 Tax=Bacillus TaxID=1386 RepID=UPI001B325288|nr:sporulation delaying protein family toxin [Bacillus sp. WL1]MBP3970749.1 sporulation delaying protein family toxin [Bacillus sp. WL1]
MIKKVRSKIIGLTLFAMLLSLFSGFSPVKSVQAATMHKYTGEEIYAGAVLGQGEVANLFPDVWNQKEFKERNTKKTKELSNNVIKEMKKIDPKFFKELETAVYNQDTNAVDKVFANGQKLLKQAADNLNLGSSVDSNTAQGRCVETGAVAIFVVVVAAGGAIDYLYVYNQTKFWGKSMDTSSQLEKEMFITNVIEAAN